MDFGPSETKRRATMFENLTPKGVQQVLRSVSPRVRVIIFKRDGCENCASTLAAARGLSTPAILYTTDIDNFQAILNAAPKPDGTNVNDVLKWAAGNTKKLPLLLRVGETGVVAMQYDRMSENELVHFISST